MLQTSFPSQKKSDEKKGETWRKECVDTAENICLYTNDFLRKSRENKIISYNLYSNILDQEDVEKIANPFNMSDSTSPAKIQNYPLLNPKIDLLVGEELKRKFDWRVRVINDDAVSKKEKQIKEIIMKSISQEIVNESFNKEDAQKKLAELQKYVTYEFQDINEKLGTNILKHLWVKEELKGRFNNAYKDLLICGEEIGQWGYCFRRTCIHKT